MSKSIYFFATRSDLVPVLSAIEADLSIKYTKAGMFDDPEMTEFTSYTEIDSLGVAVANEQNHNPSFLIVPAELDVTVRAVQQRRGGTRYGIDQLENPSSVVLRSGGVYKDSCVVAGQVGTAADDGPISLKLVNRFAREIRKQFVRINSYYVGSEAKELMGKGYRLTSDARRPREYDLSES